MVSRGFSRRRFARFVHRWGGLLAGLFFVLSGLTGSILVFRRELDRWLYPHLLRVPVPVTSVGAASTPPYSLERALRAAQRFAPAAAFTTVRMPREADGSVEFWYGTNPVRAVFVDPWRGEVLGTRAEDAHPLGWLYLLHSHLLAGERGHQLAGIMGLMLVLVGISGLVLWWPRTPWRLAWRSAFTVRRDLGPARARYDQHRVIGFWSSLLLLIAGFTGASLVFHDAFEAGFATLFRDQRPAPTAPAVVPARGQRLSLDRLLRVAEREQPDGAFSYVLLPRDAGMPMTLRRQLRGERHPNGRSYVTLDPYTGAVLAAWDARQAPRGARSYYALYPLHIGRVAGSALRWLTCVVGLAPLALAVTGWLIWRRRGNRRRPTTDLARAA